VATDEIGIISHLANENITSTGHFFVTNEPTFKFYLTLSCGVVIAYYVFSSVSLWISLSPCFTFSSTFHPSVTRPPLRFVPGDTRDTGTLMSVYYELAGHAAAVVEAVSSGDDYTASARSRAMKDTVKRMDDKQPYSPFHLSLIFSSLLKLPIETEEDVNLQLEIALRIKDIYGENHIVLLDLCKYALQSTNTQSLY